MNRIIRCCVLMAVAAWLSTGVCWQAAMSEEPTFRRLVRTGIEKNDGRALAELTGLSNPVEHVVAVEYEVLLHDGGNVRPVNPEQHEFRLGDRIRVRVQPVADTYLYIFNKGSDGEYQILMPIEQEAAPFVRAGSVVELPEAEFFEFVPPAGSEELIVVATKAPVADLALLAGALAGKPDEQCTPEERQLKSNLIGTAKKTLQSIRDRQSKEVQYRGIGEGDSPADLAAEMRRRKATRVMVKEQPGSRSGSTFAMFASSEKSDTPRLFFSIPLRSVAAGTH